MRNTVSGIYQIVNIVNGNCYIDSATDFKTRWALHVKNLNLGKHHSKYLQNAWNMYGESNFQFVILEQCPKEVLIEREQYYMDMLNPEYNVCKVAGKRSRLGLKNSPEHVEKTRQFHLGNKWSLGYKHSDETKKRMSEGSAHAMLGKHHTAEAKAKMSKALIGNKRTLGHKLSDEHKAKVSAFHKGRVKSDEERKHISEALKGSHLSEETKEKLRAINTGKVMSEESRRKMTEAHLAWWAKKKEENKE